MTKVKTPDLIILTPVAKSFALTLRAERASKVDAAAFGEYVVRNTAPCDMPEKYAELKFAEEMIKAALAELKPQVLKQVQSGNTANRYNIKLAVASGRTSFDFSKEALYIKAADRLKKAKENEKAVTAKLAAAGKGKVKQAPPTLRATIL